MAGIFEQLKDALPTVLKRLVPVLDNIDGRLTAGVERGIVRLSAAENTVCTTAETWYPAAGTFSDGCNRGFTLAADGVITYAGEGGYFLENGTSDLAVSKASKITYALFLNDTLVPGAGTPHDFVASARTQNISITRILELSAEDTLQVKIKSDTDGVTVSVKTLVVTFWGGSH